MTGFALQRLGMPMEPEPGNAQEVEGVLNPAAARGPDGSIKPPLRSLSRRRVTVTKKEGLL
jgi:hypothetical protein